MKIERHEQEFKTHEAADETGKLLKQKGLADAYGINRNTKPGPYPYRIECPSYTYTLEWTKIVGDEVE